MLMLGVPLLWHAVAPAAEPVALASAEASWSPDHHALLVRSGEATITTSCPRVVVSRWLEVRDGPPVYVTAEPLDGPLTGQGILPPRRERAIDGPRTTAPSTLRLALPEWLAADQVLAVVVRLSVPTNRPCLNGYAGSYELYRLAVP